METITYRFYRHTNKVTTYLFIAAISKSFFILNIDITLFKKFHIRMLINQFRNHEGT